jgi:hypothetical protein
MKDGTSNEDSNKVIRDINRNLNEMKTIEFKTDRTDQNN